MVQERLRGLPASIVQAVEKHVYGKTETMRMLIVGLLAGGHVLIEGPPGTAKTLASNLFAQAIGGQFKRVQLTPDMLPGDITGFNLHHTSGQPDFVPGPLFANVVLADELNRTTPRTQSAFLEAMAERQVTVEGDTHSLPDPFLVIATQVPVGGEGTYQLPEVQSDRFLLRVRSEYPTRQIEDEILTNADALEAPTLQAVTSPEEVIELKKLVKTIHVSKLVNDYILDLVETLRADQDILLGPSSRASLALYRGARVLALLGERDYVIPDDVRELAKPVLEHRVRLTAEAELDGLRPSAIVDNLLEKVPTPQSVLTS